MQSNANTVHDYTCKVVNSEHQRSHNLRKFPQIYAVFMGVVHVSHNEDIMHAFFSKVYCCLIPNHPPPIETRIWKLVVRALHMILYLSSRSLVVQTEGLYRRRHERLLTTSSKGVHQGLEHRFRRR